MRPRIAGVDVIWIIAFAVVAIVRMLSPTNGSTAHCISRATSINVARRSEPGVSSAAFTIWISPGAP